MGVALLVFSLIGCNSNNKTLNVVNNTQINDDINLLNQEFKTIAGEKVYFSFDSAKLSEEAKKTLSLQADWLNSHEKVTATIEGHCDELGNQDYNVVLGLKRAESVRNALVEYGVKASRLNVISYGKSNPKDTGHTKKARKVNRRTVTVIIKNKTTN
jgi:peptidoglycan-associated lipoprotein